MTASRFASPVTISTAHQHEVADPRRAEKLYEALSARPGVLADMKCKHILSIKTFNTEQIFELLRLAAGYESGALKPGQLPRGMILSNLFLDHTRPQIRLSFDRAWIKMGGSILNIEKTIQEMMADRTEAYQEVAELCSIASDVSVVLTQQEGVMEEMLKYFSIPIINAGNGPDEHPTHALADLYTLFKWRPDLLAAQPDNPLCIAIVGDPSYTRTIRSFLFLLAKFPQIVRRVVIMENVRKPFQPGQREELESAGLTIELVAEEYPQETASGLNKRVLPNSDVVYVHEIVHKQVRRMNLIESTELLKANAMILNPEIQAQEYADLINNSSHNAYFAQARGATFVRIALLSAIMGLY